MTENTDTFDWNAPLPPPQERVTLPEGDAKFEVLDLKRERKEMGKLGTVNVAVVTLLVTSLVAPEASDKMEENLPLSPSMVWKLYQFFASIGQYQHGDVEGGKPFTPNWGKVKASEGFCTIKMRDWTTKKGEARKSPQIDQFLDAQGRARASDEPRPIGDAVPF